MPLSMAATASLVRHQSSTLKGWTVEELVEKEIM